MKRDAFEQVCEQLHQEVLKFKAWAASLSESDRSYTLWDDEYPDWDEAMRAVRGFVQSAPLAQWTPQSIADLLYLMARDNDAEEIAREVSQDLPMLLMLAQWAVASDEPDAKWQLASRLGDVRPREPRAQAILLQMMDDGNEYVRRRALLALGQMRSVHAQVLAERAWTSGEEYQRIAALAVLHEINSPLLPRYIEMARNDGRSYVVAAAQKYASEV